MLARVQTLVPLDALVATFAAPPRVALAALEGRARGRMVRDWAALVSRRAGAAALARVRAEVPALPERPDPDAWLPIGQVLALARALVVHVTGGDVLALEALLTDDALRTRDKVLLFAVRPLGARWVLNKTAALHASLYDRGVAAADVGARTARLSFAGAPFFGDATWRLLQVFATRGMMRAFKHEVHDVKVALDGADRFALEVRWR